MDIWYKPINGTSEKFNIVTDDKNRIVKIQDSDDQYQMNWVKKGNVWGKIESSLNISVEVQRELINGKLVETYKFINKTNFDIYNLENLINIYVPLPDYYTKASVGLTQCCNAHIWCGENSSYIMALRQGGQPNHLGLLINEGAIKHYSTERSYDFSGKEEEVSNNRGLIILHPENFVIHPGESYILQWELFWFKDKSDFKKHINESKNFVNITSNSFVVTDRKESIKFNVNVKNIEGLNLEITDNGQLINYTGDYPNFNVEVHDPAIGEHRIVIKYGDGKSTHANFLVTDDLYTLAKRRVDFIVKNQQLHDVKSSLNGAYLIYDNEENQQYYSHLNDHNGGRERVGMGVLIARYLINHPDNQIHNSLQTYISYIINNLFNAETGEVYNDVSQNNDDPRLYNYPWVAHLFLEMYELENEKNI